MGKGKGKGRKKGGKGTRRKKPALTAATADKYALYQRAVQCPEAEIDFVERVFKKAWGRKPRLIKEDFCGTHLAACEFVRRHRKNRALGVDLDPEPLAWGREHNQPALGDAASRLLLLEDDVRAVTAPAVEAVLAMNFSYFLFKERSALARYFRAVRDSLQPGGILVADAYGGSEAQVPQEEERSYPGFTYVWDQHAYNPITGDVVNYIHFRFPDGTGLERAFRYDWRLWSLREITELLLEVGFETADVYWEGWDEEEEEGNGIFRKTRRAENSAGWIAYVVARRP